MTKTKRQLRAEAVERLENGKGRDAFYRSILNDAVEHGVGMMTCDRIRDALIDLLQDDEPSGYGIRFADALERPAELMDGETVYDYEGKAVGWVTAPAEVVLNAEEYDLVPESGDVSYTGSADVTECSDAQATDQVFVPKRQLEPDTREKLESDIGNLVVRDSDVRSLDYPMVFAPLNDVLSWLDRQVAITRREMNGIWGDYSDSAQREIAELQAKVDELLAANLPDRESVAPETPETGESNAAKCEMRDFDDTREKLEEDLYELLLDAGEWIGSQDYPDEAVKDYFNDYHRKPFHELLDRQADITELECIARQNGKDPDYIRIVKELDAKCDALQAKVDALVAERRALQARVVDLEAENADDARAINNLANQLKNMTGARDHWQRVAGKNGEELGKLRKALEHDKRMRAGGLPDGIEWPRFKDGALVRFGDEFAWGDNTYKVDKFEFQRGFTGVCGQAHCSAAPIKRPRLLASDGEPIEVDQTLYGLSDGKAWTVREIDRTKNHPVLGSRMDWGHGDREVSYGGVKRALKPEWLTHEEPDSLEAIAYDLRKMSSDFASDVYKRDECGSLDGLAARIEKMGGKA